MDLKHGSVSALPYNDDTFDKVFAINSSPFWPEPAENLKELQRVLKPGGLIAITLQPRWAKTDEMVQEIGEEIATQLATAGFGRVRPAFKSMKPVTSVCVLGIKVALERCLT